ncbi:hypothetical protein [Haloflavibacter putidus]|uniref:Uncharacterized protein n=1 Tax=Haloflavibacter putidus TaxID=2576776 RepID=A0A508A4P4_9FLAO|nr:hypothetical protein [Haloflavibacter putidus]TQD40782.1 hypothetical protein FKR84_02030 [Haloflavibacter putidus]
MKKLNKQQIERLYNFTDAHFVEYQEVQNELVDHLANAIEAQWEINPNKDFETALQEEFKKFGVYGFLEVVEARQKTIEKRYYKIILREIKAFLNLPRIVVLVGLFLLSFRQLTKWQYGSYILVCTLVSLIVLSFIKIFKSRKRQKLLAKQQNRKPYLLENLIAQAGHLAIFANLPVQIFVFLPDSLLGNFWFGLVYSLVFTAFCLLLYAALVLLPRKREKLLKETYPEWKFYE